MEQYSEIIGSFIRKGNYPLEANYIFNSKEELKEFYKDAINNAQLHEGLFKVVKENDNQILYWVTSINNKLEFVPLIKADSIETLSSKLSELSNQFNTSSQTIININKILGTTTTYTDAVQAVNALLDAGFSDYKYDGVIIVYNTTDGWVCKQFFGNPDTDYNNLDNWKDFGNSGSDLIAITQAEYDEMQAMGTWEDFASSYTTIYIYEEEV